MKPARSALAIVCAVAFVAVMARFDVALPGAPVPQSMQTLAVVLVGAYVGVNLGPASLVLYLLLGALGAPVFAGGTSGPAVVSGPSGGYLLGFVVAVALVAHAVSRGWASRLLGALACALAAHGVILALGWCWLSLRVGASAAWQSGVQPFILGGLVKSILAGLPIWDRVRVRVLGK